MKNIGGKYSFVLYCLIAIRKNINDVVYISVREMNGLIFNDKNTTRGYKKVRNSLTLLKNNGLIEFDETNTYSDIIKINWINLFPNQSDSGWVKFLYNDFDMFEVVGVDFYCIMWLMRMYANHETGRSFVTVRDMGILIGCKTVEVQRAIDFFEYVELFEVKRGEYYKPKGSEGESAVKRNNSYKYIGDIGDILKLNLYKP